MASLTPSGRRNSRLVVVNLTSGRVELKGQFRGTLRDITLAA